MAGLLDSVLISAKRLPDDEKSVFRILTLVIGTIVWSI